MRRTLITISLLITIATGCGSAQEKTTVKSSPEPTVQQNTWPPAEQVHQVNGGFDGEISKIVLIEAKTSDTVTDKFDKVYKAGPDKQFYIYQLKITNKENRPVNYVFPAFYTIKGEKFGETIYLDKGGGADEKIPPNGEGTQTVAAEASKAEWPYLTTEGWDDNEHYFTGKAGN